MITYRCPRCKATLESDDNLAGKSDVCPLCRQQVSVPVKMKRRVPVLILSIAGGLVVIGIVVAVFVILRNPKQPQSQVAEMSAPTPSQQMPVPSSSPSATPTAEKAAAEKKVAEERALAEKAAAEAKAAEEKAAVDKAAAEKKVAEERALAEKAAAEAKAAEEKAAVDKAAAEKNAAEQKAAKVSNEVTDLIDKVTDTSKIEASRDGTSLFGALFGHTGSITSATENVKAKGLESEAVRELTKLVAQRKGSTPHDTFVRSGVVTALEQFKNKPDLVLPLLRKLAKDSEKLVSNDASRAIAELEKQNK
jgi:flagellar biosynthesis GTPase FlhF